jgi:hypothetical protein
VDVKQDGIVEAVVDEEAKVEAIVAVEEDVTEEDVTELKKIISFNTCYTILVASLDAYILLLVHSLGSSTCSLSRSKHLIYL